MTGPTDPIDPTPAAPDGADDDHDPVLEAAGARLRGSSRALDPAAVELGSLRRRARRRGIAAVAAGIVAVGALAGAVVVARDPGGDVQLASGRPGAPTADEVQRILDGLDDQPVDPTQVDLVPTVSSYADCDALVADLRQVGAEHVGSRGFGGGATFAAVGARVEEGEWNASADDSGAASAAPADGGVTLGTNVQVEGVDELDFVKAVGDLVYDLDRNGDLRVTEAASGTVLSTLDVTPGADDDEDGGGAQVSDLLVADGRVAVFGSEVEVSEPVEGDPSATRASVPFMTVTLVDVADPAAPEVTDRVRLEGSLVSARLVGGEVRLVTSSDMADLGFVMPTTPASVATALGQNRRTVASSTVEDWVPDWQRDGSDAEPLVPCDRVYVPDTFAGVAMTSMVTFPVADRFAPSATSIVAPSTTLYAGTEKVAISSEVWVDPIDREGLEFDDWQTAVHEFAFGEGDAPTYVGSGVVDGSTVGQFAFGEVGGSLAVVTTSGTPWGQAPDAAIDMTVLTPDDDGGLDAAATVADIADGEGAVAAVRFVEGRVLVSTGSFGRQVLVIDVSDPEAPRRAGRVDVPGDVGYFHPLPDQRALLVGSRFDEVGEGDDRRSRSWAQAHLLDVSDPDAPVVVSTWERPWTSDEVAYDHHAFTYWPDRQLAMWGLAVGEPDAPGRLNEAAVVAIDGGVTEVAVPTASLAPEAGPPCPAVEVTDAEVRQMIGRDGVVLHCDEGDVDEVDWPRYQCYRADDGTVARFVPEDQRGGSYLVCSPAPPPVVRRVLVVGGVPYLLTDQTLDALDPETFASTSVSYHPSGGGVGAF